MLWPWEHVRQHQVLWHCVHAASLLPSAFPSHRSLPRGKKLKSMGVPSPWEPSCSPTQQLPSPEQSTTHGGAANIICLFCSSLS